jgi:uncharacterized protein YcbX
MRAAEPKYFADATDDSSQAIEWTMPAGRYVDSAAVLVLSTASLRTAAELHPGVWDPQRFRPNVLLGVEGKGWLEDQWAGRPLSIGAVVLVPPEGFGAAPCRSRYVSMTLSAPTITSCARQGPPTARHSRGYFHR